MKIEVRARGVDVSDEMRTYIARRLRFSLGRFDGHLQVVRVRLEDLNGPRGGVDKRCSLELSGDRLGSRFVEVRDSDFHAAVGRAARAAGRTIRDAIDRTRVEAPVPDRIAIRP